MYNPVLPTLIMVADKGSFNKAAEALYISSTAVIKQMNNFENHLGIKLFERTPHGVRLTESGKKIYDEAKHIIAISDKAIIEASKASPNFTYTFTVGTSKAYPCDYFFTVWNDVKRYFPGCKIDIVSFDDHHDRYINSMKRLNQDIDFILGMAKLDILKDYNFLKLRDAKKYIGVPVNHPLYSRDHLDYTDLYGYSLLIAPANDSLTNDRLRNFIASNHPQIKLEDSLYPYDINTFNQCVDENKVMVSFDIWENVHPLIKNVPMDISSTVSYGLIYSKTPSPEVNNFINVMKSLYPEAISLN